MSDAQSANERLQILARFIRNQVSLADRPPPGCIQLNNDEALLCAEALERSLVETSGDAQRDIAALRLMLAGAYSGSNLYTDDGELQDGSCLPVIDFARDSVGEIDRKIQERGRRKLAESRDETSGDATDAARYRWLRDCTYVEAYWIDGAGGVDEIRLQGAHDFLDVAVDSEMKAEADRRAEKAGGPPNG